MQCPGCGGPTIAATAKLKIALRAQVRCPACGVQVRLSLWPRIAHAVLGDLALLAGFVLAWRLEMPGPLVLAIAWWLVLSLAMPTRAGAKAPDAPS